VIDQLAAGSPQAHDIAAIIATHAHWDHISSVLIGEDADAIQMNIARIRTAVAKVPQIQPTPAHDGRANQKLPNFPSVAR
jgi:glyoxylase-like metal-dependent hydrolase (beta-lactamase superfamily II)